MQNYKPGTNVPLTFSLVDESGSFLTPTSIRWRILDEAELELQAWAVIAVLPTTSDLTVVIPLALTALVPTAMRVIRTVELELVTARGTVQLSDSVMIQGTTALLFGVNTFHTYPQALLVTEDFTADGMAGWASADRDTREKALIEAYGRVMQCPLGVRTLDSQSTLNQDSSFIRSFGPAMVRDMTPSQLLALYPPMLTDLRRAQTVEANDILLADPIQEAHKSGLVSMTTGETSQSFRTSAPLDLPVGPRAMKYLQRWISFNARIGRS